MTVSEFIFRAWMVIAFLIIIFAGITHPTEKDIQKCVEVTNYTAERCRWEMTR